ncbi:22525_t:CDS:2 [Dentiscutata erythropus]|uniref:22525_t:CDS:1 n=1 Tax=Dentiscutata erythropus TaxID=1348616 RepID=A0A9N9APE2_9GLOM|nr:22525_t:CDS:2 [Dentiscutata erythropus]
MPCYADTIIKIKHAKRNEKEDVKVPSVWALVTYPPGHNDKEIEVTLFLPINQDERDPELQAIFKRDEYYSVGGKIVPGSYNGKIKPKMTVAVSTHITIVDKVLTSNKCPLKTSLIGIPQEMPIEIRNTYI